jgi:hypothetical protein
MHYQAFSGGRRIDKSSRLISPTMINRARDRKIVDLLLRDGFAV